MEETFWTLPRIAGAIVIASAAALAVVTLAFSINGDARAIEASFRDLDAAMGNTTTLRVMSLSWGAWSIAVLAGFAVLTVEFWNRDVKLIPTLAIVGLTLFSVVWVIEAAFHASVTVWAVQQLEQGAEVPALFLELKRWFNFWVQLLVNPLSLLAFLGLAVVGMQTEVIPSWTAWSIIIWSGLFVFFPLPLLIVPVPLFFGTVLLING